MTHSLTRNTLFSVLTQTQTTIGDSTMKITSKISLIFAITITANLFIHAQNRNAAITAFKNWKTNAFKNLDKSKSYKFQGFGVAVEKFQNNGINVNFSIGTSLSVNEINSLTFTVQPLSITTDNNKSQIKEIGAASKLQSSKIVRTEAENEEIILNPQITVPITNDVNAVKVSISGFEDNEQKTYTVILPVTSETKTAGLGKVTLETETQTLEGK